MEKIKVMIIGNNDTRIFEIKSLLKNNAIIFVGFSKLTELAIEKASSLNPQVIIIHMDNDNNDAILLAEKIYMNIPRSKVILLCEDQSTSIIDQVMFAGVRKVLEYPISSDELVKSIQVVNQVEKSRRENASVRYSPMESKIVTVFGTKGGIGKTTIAVNLAITLAKLGKKVAIIDANLEFGDVDVFLDLNPKDTISELTQERDIENIEAIKRMMMLHHSGVSVLCAPKSPEYAEYVSAKNIQKIINAMRPFYDYIFIDTVPSFNEINMITLENANIILLIVESDISTIRNTKVALNIFESLKLREKTEIVGNRIAKNLISIKDIQRVLECQIKHKIPQDLKVGPPCHNKGIPIVIDAPRSAIAKEFKKIGKGILETIENF
jgi:pilus assembly protein CpaE